MATVAMGKHFFSVSESKQLSQNEVHTTSKQEYLLMVFTWNPDEVNNLNAYFNILDFLTELFQINNVIYFGLNYSASYYSKDDIELP